MRYYFKKKLLYSFIIVIIVFTILHVINNDGQQIYDNIETDNILKNLCEEPAINFTSSAMIECNYYDIIHDDTTFSLAVIDGDLVEGHNIREGGEYAPQDCKPKYSTAIIVSYR